jgi:rhamnose utilization protein RhaD (predicted bifunctional aldolase and dehydrogenase)
MSLRYLVDLWDEKLAKTLDPADLLRYRSNLLGADLRITNFGGGNTSSNSRTFTAAWSTKMRWLGCTLFAPLATIQ